MQKRVLIPLLVICLIIIIPLEEAFANTHNSSIVTVTTNQDTYYRGDSITISGEVTNFTVSRNSIDIKIVHEDNPDDLTLHTFTELNGEGKFYLSLQTIPILSSNFPKLGEYKVIAQYSNDFNSFIEEITFEIVTTPTTLLPTKPELVEVNFLSDDTFIVFSNVERMGNIQSTHFEVSADGFSDWGDCNVFKSFIQINLVTTTINSCPSEIEHNYFRISFSNQYGKGEVSNILPELKAIKTENFVDIDFNKDTKDMFLEWDFGNRDSCHVKTEGVLNGTKTHFFGHDIDLQLRGHRIQVTNNSEIECSGDLKLNFSDFSNETLTYFTMFMSFYSAETVIVNDQKSTRLNGLAEIVLLYSENSYMQPLNCGIPSHIDTFANIVDYVVDPHKIIKTTALNGICNGGEYIWQKSMDKKNGGGCSDCVPPTIGLDLNFNRVVDNGFSYNDNKVQVEKWFTEFPLIEVNIGEENLLETKVYENNGINNMKWIQACFGATEKGISLEKCEALVTIHLETNGTLDWIGIEKIDIVDKDNLLDNESLRADVYVTNCEDNPSLENPRQCVKLELYHTFREAPINNMVIINVADKPLNSQNFHFNHGITVYGISLNGEPTITLFHKDSSQDTTNNWTTYTRDSKVNDTWTDQNKIQYQKTNDYSFVRITPLEDKVCKDSPLDEIQVWTRNNCNYIPYQEQQARDTLDIMSELCPSCLLPSFHEMKESFAHNIMPSIDKLNDPEMIILLEIEYQKAIEYLKSKQ